MRRRVFIEIDIYRFELLGINEIKNSCRHAPKSIIIMHITSNAVASKGLYATFSRMLAVPKEVLEDA